MITEKTNTEKNLKKIKGIKKKYFYAKSQHCDDCDDEECQTCKPEFDELRKQAQIIADNNKFEGGCESIDKTNISRACGDILFNNTIYLCLDCQNKKEIQEINERIQNKNHTLQSEGIIPAGLLPKNNNLRGNDSGMVSIAGISGSTPDFSPKLLPLSEKIVANADACFPEPVLFVDDVKQSINGCLNKLVSKFPTKSKDFIQLNEIEKCFEEYFGDLIE